jgi:ubiquinone/menaquinone biosynthesis C-methylase UbiE
MSSLNEIQVAKAFSKQSVLFDGIYSGDTIIQYKRDRVRAHVKRFLQPASHILELNAGTGEDAIFFAGEGHTIHATDLSTGMQEILQKKVFSKGLADRITNETCSFTSLENLVSKGPYDHIFSNFAGLNCTDELDKVLSSLSPLLTKNGIVTLVVLPKFCLWEFLLLAKGKIKTALRRFGGKNGAQSHIEGEYFRCWYYQPSYISEKLKNDFDVLLLEGLCTLVPPSYMEGFAEKHPRVYPFLCKLENRFRYSWPWRSIGDYYIISLRKK